MDAPLDQKLAKSCLSKPQLSKQKQVEVLYYHQVKEFRRYLNQVEQQDIRDSQILKII